MLFQAESVPGTNQKWAMRVQFLAQDDNGSFWWGSNSHVTCIRRLRARRANSCTTLPIDAWMARSLINHHAKGDHNESLVVEVIFLVPIRDGCQHIFTITFAWTLYNSFIIKQQKRNGINVLRCVRRHLSTIFHFYIVNI